MKKSIVVSILTLLITVGSASAVNINDIDDILSVSLLIVRHASGLAQFATKLKSLKEGGFVITVEGSTQTVTLSLDQKLGLLAEYQNRKAQLQADWNALP